MDKDQQLEIEYIYQINSCIEMSIDEVLISHWEYLQTQAWFICDLKMLKIFLDAMDRNIRVNWASANLKNHLAKLGLLVQVKIPKS